MAEKTKARPQDDLYEYVNGDFIKKARIPSDHPSVGGFITLRDNVEKIMLREFQSFANGRRAPDELLERAILLYKKVLDTEGRKKIGYRPLIEKLSYLDSIKTLDDLTASFYYLYDHNYPLPFQLGIDTDMKDTRRHVIAMTGPSIILPDTTYYQNNENGKKLLNVYADSATEILANVYGETKAKKLVHDALAFDKRIAGLVKSQEEWADYVKSYNPTETEAVIEKVFPIRLGDFLQSRFGTLPEKIVIMDPRFFDNFSSLLNEKTIREYVAWAKMTLAMGMANYLDEETRILASSYSRALSGVKDSPTTEKFAYRLVNSFYGEPIGIYYGKKYFGEEAKKDVIKIVQDLIETYKERLAENTWLSKKTREKAIVKLDKMVLKIGYPEKADPSYYALTFSPESSLFEIVDTLAIERGRYGDSLFSKPVDRTRWVMDAHLVNACYNPSYNDITFPAAILQAPFYSLEQKPEENYGGIGTVIGHEISHAFDNNGAQMDEFGNINNWWTKKDYDVFQKKTQAMIEQFDGLPLLDSKVNGKLVVSENIADNGGVASSLQTMERNIKKPDYQAFFLNFARIWCTKARPQYTKLLLNIDVHSPCYYRADMQVRNFPQFHAAFKVKEGDGMYMPVDKRIIIW